MFSSAYFILLVRSEKVMALPTSLVCNDSPVQITQSGALTQASVTVPLTARLQTPLDIIKVLIFKSLNQLQQVHQQVLHRNRISFRNEVLDMYKKRTIALRSINVILLTNI